MAKIIEFTQADGNPALVNADAVTLVITTNPALGSPPNANAVIHVGGQQIAVRETVTDIKTRLLAESDRGGPPMDPFHLVAVAAAIIR